MVQHGEHTGGALWYSKVRPAEVAEVVHGVGDTDFALGRGGAVIVGGMPCHALILELTQYCALFV